MPHHADPQDLLRAWQPGGAPLPDDALAELRRLNGRRLLGGAMTVKLGAYERWAAHRPSPPPPPAPSPKSAARPSGLPWESGVCCSSNDAGMVEQVKAFAAFRGRPVDVVNVKSVGTKGVAELRSSLLGKEAVYKALYDLGCSVSQVIDFVPQDVGGDGLAMSAKGAFDAMWEETTKALADMPRRRQYAIRAGHELDATYQWGPNANIDGYKSSFRRFVKIARKNIPGVLIDWNWLRRPHADYDACYPGDDVVDIVGMDPYGNEDGLDSAVGIEQYLTRRTSSGTPASPRAALLWAKDKGKKVGFAEWGVSIDGAKGARDYPMYVKAMWSFFRQNAEFLAYEVYFNIDAAGEGAGRNHLLTKGTAAPHAAAEYASLWKAGV